MNQETRLAREAEIRAQHEAMIYPVVRVRTEKAGGSGTVIYSRGVGGEAVSIILTNWHVIENSIHVKEEFDRWLGRNRKVEQLDFVGVEVFKYNNISRKAWQGAGQAEILSYSEAEDIAVLRLLDKSNPVAHVANMFPKGDDLQLHAGHKIYAVGCTLGHSTIHASGEITSLGSMDDILDGNKEYWMGSAPISFGNSGGAVFLDEDFAKYQFIGIPSRVAIQGWTGAPLNTMAYFIPIPRIYRWLESELLSFLWDPSTTPQQCFEARQARRQRGEKEMQAIQQGMKGE